MLEEEPPPGRDVRVVREAGGVRCPACKALPTSVVETRTFEGPTFRRRRCECGARWQSVEKVVKGTLTTLTHTTNGQHMGNGQATASPDLTHAANYSGSDPIRDPDLGSDPLPLISPPERAIPGATEAPLMVFPTAGNPREFAVLPSLLKQHEEVFPALDVMEQYRRALGWVRDNPSRRKTARGMRAFLNRWLSTAQDSGKGLRKLNGHAPPKLERCDWHAEHYTHRTQQSRRPKESCDWCREYAARNSGRAGEPEPLFETGVRR